MSQHRPPAAVARHRRTPVALVLLLSACATVYHHSADITAACKSQHRQFVAFAECVWSDLDGRVSAREQEQLRGMLEQLKAAVDAGTMSNGLAIRRFESEMRDRARQIDAERVQTAAVVGLVLGTAAVIATGGLSGGSSGDSSSHVHVPSAGDPSSVRISRHSIRGCCSGRGGAAGVQDQRILCHNGELSPTCLVDGGRIQSSTVTTDKRGCCSWHGGICGYSGDRVLCCDRQPSPTCRVY